MLGFPLGLKDGREDLSVAEAGRIVGTLPDDVAAVCITYLDRASDISDLCSKLGARWVQLHGRIDVAEAAQLRDSDPGLGIIKSLIVGRGSELLAELSAFEPHVDAFITDTYDPETGRQGATGMTHDWAVSRSVVRATERPVILAGGLNGENVAAAIAAVRPAAVDAHTGVEGPDGRKRGSLVGAFVSASMAAFARLG